MKGVNTFLMFKDQAEEAVKFYASVFPRARVIDIAYSDGDVENENAPAIPAGKVKPGDLFFGLAGQDAHFAFRHQIESIAWISSGQNPFAHAVAFRVNTLGQPLHFLLTDLGEQVHASQKLKALVDKHYPADGQQQSQS